MKGHCSGEVHQSTDKGIIFREKGRDISKIFGVIGGTEERWVEMQLILKTCGRTLKDSPVLASITRESLSVESPERISGSYRLKQR